MFLIEIAFLHFGWPTPFFDGGYNPQSWAEIRALLPRLAVVPLAISISVAYAFFKK
jgi:hypothetical protein